MAEQGAEQATGVKPAAKPGDADKRIAQPCSPQALAEYGELQTPPPAEPLDPTGARRQCYRIWMSGGAWANYRGMLVLERTAESEGGFVLNVRQEWLADRMRAVHETTAVIRSRADVLATPLEWRLRSRVVDVMTGEEFPRGTVVQTGRTVPEGVEVTTNGISSIRRVHGERTSNWSLFEAVQRPSPVVTDPLPFTLLEDLDVAKEDHRLTFRGIEEHEFAGERSRLKRYDCVGRGCLPCICYVGPHGHLVLAHTALQAYILDPNVQDTHSRKLEALARKELK